MTAQRLPTPGQDDGTWGNVLNSFLAVSLNTDGTLVPGAVTTAGAYSKPSSGIPGTDIANATITNANVSASAAIARTKLDSSTQASLTLADNAPTTLAALTDVAGAGGATNTQVLTYSTSTSKWGPATVSGSVVGDASTSAKGIVQLANDLGGTATAPTVPGLANKINSSVATAKGDVLVATASATVSRVAVGTNNQVLTADSTQATGVKWATPAAGGGGVSYTFSTKTADYTATASDYIFVDSTSNGITITLPAPAANATVRVKRLNPAGNSVQVAAPSGSYIDAVAVGTDTLNSQYQGQDYLSDGTNWYRV